jgi:hypothetical protein
MEMIFACCVVMLRVEVCQKHLAPWKRNSAQVVPTPGYALFFADLVSDLGNGVHASISSKPQCTLLWKPSPLQDVLCGQGIECL